VASTIVHYQILSRCRGSRFLVRESSERDPPAPSLGQRIRAVAGMRRLSARTERAYTGWIRRFIACHSGRHPLELGKDELEAFLSDLAVRGGVSVSTLNLRISARITTQDGER